MIVESIESDPIGGCCEGRTATCRIWEIHDKEVIHTIQLKNQNGHVFYDKLTFIYLTLPHFNKSLNELHTTQDKWLYIFRHLHEIQEIPPVLHEAIFLKLFEAAQIACFNPAERQAYEDSLKYYRDLKNVTDTARDEGEQKKAVEIARNLLDVLDDETIAQKTRPNTPSALFWSSSPVADGAGAVYFGYGYDGWDGKNVEFKVRLVRSGQ